MARICLIIIWTLSPVFFTQAQDTLEISLPTVEIQATRTFETTLSAARSIYVKQRDNAMVSPGLSLQRSLRGIPGVRITDRGHYALGERVLVRGMGYRAAFGVRGVQAFLNGIPLTLPDGQSMLDIVDPAFIRRAELLRGPSSIYWGNASGGALFLSTFTDTSSVQLRYMGGSYGLSNCWSQPMDVDNDTICKPMLREYIKRGIVSIAEVDSFVLERADMHWLDHRYSA